MSVRILWTAGCACLPATTAACSPLAPHDPAGRDSRASSASKIGSDSVSWSSHGSTACQQYLNPDLVGQIFEKPAGQSKQLGNGWCSFDTPSFKGIDIVLIHVGASAFDTDPNTQDATPISGVGDKAVRTASGIEAYKMHRGICQIDVTPLFTAKLKGAALAQKLGKVCNQLFALR